MDRDEKGRYFKGCKVSKETLQKRKGQGNNTGKHWKMSEETKLKFSLIRQGKNANNWKGGRIKHSAGYIEFYKPGHPYCFKGNYVLEHRLVMEEFLGRYLTPEEKVHHINGIKDDNRIENLMLFADNREHSNYHVRLSKAV